MQAALTYNVMNSLQMLDSNSLTQSELNHFTKFCCSVSFSCVNRRRKSLTKLTDKNSITLYDIATNALIPLFSRNESDELYVLKNAFRNWQPAIKTQTDAIAFLNKIIDHRVEQQISALLKEDDPLFAKILTYVLYMAKKKGFIKKNINGTVHLIQNNGEEIAGSTIDSHNFQLLPVRLFLSEDNMFDDILSYLNSETAFAQAIPLNQLVQKLKSFRQNEFDYMDRNANILSELAINDIVKLGLQEALSKLETTYIKKKKLSRTEGNIFRKTLTDLAEDIKEGGIHPGFYEYISLYMKNISKEKYREDYQYILEYLYKLMKNTIAAQLIC
ncbi:MAG: hypothetical protein ACM3Q2_18870 [Syntrophothermus sp.]